MHFIMPGEYPGRKEYADRQPDNAPNLGGKKQGNVRQIASVAQDAPAEKNVQQRKE
jgi:hypothetical protein